MHYISKNLNIETTTNTNHGFSWKLRNKRLNNQCVNGAAANIFQKKAIGKFFMIVPAQIAGSWEIGIPAIITLKRIEATRLMVGHMTATVPAWRIFWQKYGLSFCGSQCRATKAAPTRFSHRFENRITNNPI